MSQYDTLNVSLQTDNRRYNERTSKTIDVENDSDHEDDAGGESEERVKRFRELYYRNEKLRRELKTLNAKLNERLERVKFPNVKAKAASVDLNRKPVNPPTKALIRELQNAEKQVNMYRKQVQALKIKEQTPENYAKLKNMENAIAYKDIEINQVQSQLISIKNIKKMQQKKIASELENEQITERLQQYQKQHRELRKKMKDIARKSRRREEDYKKQQAYVVNLEKYMRGLDEKEQAEEKAVPTLNKEQERPNREISHEQFMYVKMQITAQKKANDELLKKAEKTKKQYLKIKKQTKQLQNQFKEKEAFAKTLRTKIEALNRLLTEQERRPKTPKNKLITKLEQLDLGEEKMELGEKSITKNDPSLQKMLNQMERIEQDERNWKGKYRKVQQGFGAPTDRRFQFQGELVGMTVNLDENEIICGLGFIFDDEHGKHREQMEGKRTNIELKWSIEHEDDIKKIEGSFSQQGYLSHLYMSSYEGKEGRFGHAGLNSFQFNISPHEKISSCFGAIRQLGQDIRITQLGFWIEKQE